MKAWGLVLRRNMIDVQVKPNKGFQLKLRMRPCERLECIKAIHVDNSIARDLQIIADMHFRS
jgi:hypothetical protein